MLQTLTIQNFALIESLHVNFTSGLSTITGETGAGKSLLLGALGLIIGKRVDTSVIKNAEKKCVVEAYFNVSDYELTAFFEEEDLDYEEETCIRREILPSGKSRAFVNDTPVTLKVLQSLGEQLIDIHSQHQTLEVTQPEFQFYILDALAKTTKELASFTRGLKQLKLAKKELKALQENELRFKEEYNYNSHLLTELLEAAIKVEEQSELEELLEKLSNTEEIQERLAFAVGSITAESHGAFDQLTEAKNSMQKIASYSLAYDELFKRLESVCIELDDLRSSMEQQAELVDADPQKLGSVNDRLQLLYNLQKKHSVGTNEELLNVQKVLQEKVSVTENMHEAIEKAQLAVSDVERKLNSLADKIHTKRTKVLKGLTNKLEDILAQLGMQNATFKPVLERIDTFNSFGGNSFELLFSANKGGQFGTLKKVASGGELSRIMLAVKMLLSQYIKLPTIIFDEIDTGVSGEVAQKMANLLYDMSASQQVFSITHLPQIAAKGSIQYKVFKEDIDNVTYTQLKQLNELDRIAEIAEMIGGKQLTEAAQAHAKSLLAIQ
ncbi:DNA repair protein RecN [Aquimarina agarilytica]|uniref:DNA repair protein RecN n=1 Tax=Aquimarina agarilytica TaxID=1087449 RepID=UPI0002890C7E|nr:DNA repair protein RecN [Aquimarina agarilytica]